MPRISDLIGEMQEANYNDYMITRARKLIYDLKDKRVNPERFIQRLINAVKNSSEEYIDIITEGRFALIIAKRGFSAIRLEYSDSGPDISAKWNRNVIYFEIKRIRPRQDDQKAHESVVWIDPVELTIIGIIQEKMSQLLQGERNVFVIWSDTVDFLEEGMQNSWNYIRQEIDGNPGSYTKLSGILFTSGGYRFSPLKQFRLYENTVASKRLGARLCRKLENLFENNPREVVDENNRLGREIKRLLHSQKQ